ncbi:hypothetical protein ABH920_004056 [Catenulispora sp. EB89]
MGDGALSAAVTAGWYVVFTLLVARGRARVSCPGVQRG